MKNIELQAMSKKFNITNEKRTNAFKIKNCDHYKIYHKKRLKKLKSFHLLFLHLIYKNSRIFHICSKLSKLIKK